MWTANIPSSQNLINKTRSGLALTLFFIIFLCYTLSRLNEHYPFFFFSFFFFLFSVMLNLTVPSHEKGLALTNWPKNKKKNTRSKKNLCCLANWPPTCLLPHNPWTTVTVLSTLLFSGRVYFALWFNRVFLKNKFFNLNKWQNDTFKKKNKLGLFDITILPLMCYDVQKYVILSKYFFVSTAFHLLFAFYILIAQFIFR